MPEHVHLLVNEPPCATVADAVHYLKLSFAKRVQSLVMAGSGSFWQKRYYDRNVRDAEEFKAGGAPFPATSKGFCVSDHETRVAHPCVLCKGGPSHF